jgi:transposase-like protein
MLKTFETRQNENVSLREIARGLDVDPSQLHRWRKQYPELQRFHDEKRISVKALHCGRTSQLHEIEDALLSFISGNREQGIPVSIRMVTMKASELDDAFRKKSSIAKDHAIRRFVKSHVLALPNVEDISNQPITI